MNLLEQIHRLPMASGIYQYFDDQDRLLYVGKAKNLKHRVRSYFKFTPCLSPSVKLSSRIEKMIRETYQLQWILTENEHDALILENSLIKQLKPKYNILLRDDKTYPYLYVDFDQIYPRLELTRKVIKKKNIKYFGPYSTGARDILESIYEIFPLVQKKSCLGSKKACLFYQIKRCLAPCEGKITPEEYQCIIQNALNALNNTTDLLVQLETKMQDYSEQYRFEEALKLRNKIDAIKRSHVKSTVDLVRTTNLDLFCIESDAQTVVVIKFFIREGKLASSGHQFMAHNQDQDLNKEEVYKRTLINYYCDDLPILPDEIIIGDKIEDQQELEEFIYTRYNRSIPLVCPKIGKKHSLVMVARKNAQELLRIHKKNSNTRSDLNAQLRTLLMLEHIPHRIESFDNSHMMGQANVGAMVVWEGEWIKKAFRHYNLISKDEYSQMKEMLRNRLDNLEKNPPPDLWILDGGETLLKLAFELCYSVGLTLDIIAIAKEKIDHKANRSKGRANDLIYYKNKENVIEVLRLVSSDKRLHFIQKQRDEAHRFAIGFHQKQKRKEDKLSSLLQIRGIGPAKIKKLLSYFGSFDLIRHASVEELKEVLNEKESKLIVQYFKELDGPWQ